MNYFLIPQMERSLLLAVVTLTVGAVLLVPGTALTIHGQGLGTAGGTLHPVTIVGITCLVLGFLLLVLGSIQLVFYFCRFREQDEMNIFSVRSSETFPPHMLAPPTLEDMAQLGDPRLVYEEDLSGLPPSDCHSTGNEGGPPFENTAYGHGDHPAKVSDYVQRY